MNSKKVFSILLILIIFMLAISAASASEDITSDIDSIKADEGIVLEETPTENDLNNANEELILEETPIEESLNVENENAPLSETPGNFRDLENLINNNANPEITLDRDYVYSTSDDLRGGITINRTVTIDGNGFTINGDVKARIFNVTNSSVVFKNIHFLGGDSRGDGGAILGECTAINCTFTSNHANNGLGGAMNGGTAINCTFTNNYATGDYDADGGAMSGGIAINCTFTNNRGKLGGAIYSGIARNCTFINNYAKNDGGAMCGGIAVNSHFENNTIEDDGYEDPHNALSDAFALNCTFVNNGWDYESIVVDRANFDINNFTGKMADEEKRIYMNLIGFRGDADANIRDINCTLRVYKDGELYETRYLKTCRAWMIDLPEGNYTATVGIDNVPEVEMANFTIKLTKNPSKIIAENITAVYKNETTLKVMFVNEENYWPIKNSGVSIDIDGNVTTAETDGGGCIFIPLKDLSIGEHNATFSMVGHTEYEDVSKTITITIIKVPTVIECENPYVTIYNTSEYFAIRVTDIYGNPLAVLSVDIDLFPGDYFITNDTGYANVPPSYFQRLAAGNYTAKISCPGTTYDIYGPSEKNVTIIIEKQKAFVNSSNVNTTFNSDDKITATLINEQGNPISGAALTIDLFEGETFTTDENGQIEVPTNTLPVGTYETKIIFNGSENYEYAGYRIFVTINKRSAQLFAENITTSIDNESNMTITLKDDQNRPIANAQITVGIEDFEEKTTDANGEVKISTKDLEINKHNVFIIFNGNENYAASNMIIASITITKGTPIVTVGDCSVNWGETATVNVAVKDKNGTPISGIVKVSVAGYEEYGYEYLVPLDETGKGQATFVSELIPRAYRLKAVFLANDDYEIAEDDGLLIVHDSIKLNLEISANQTVFGEDTILTVKATDGRGETVNVRKLNITVGDEETKQYDVESGVVNLGKLAVGNTLIQVISDNILYEPVTVNVTVTVLPATPELTVSPGDANVTIEAKCNGNPISGTANIYIDGNTENPITVTIDETGTLTVPLNDLSKGNHAVEVVFSNENYTTITKTIAVNIPKIVTVLSVTGSTVQLGDKSTVTIQLTDENNNPVRGTVIVSVDWTGDIATDNVELDEEGKGQAKLSYIEIPGTYTVIAKFIGDDDYAQAINDTENITIADNKNIDFNAEVNEDLTEIIITDAKDTDTGEAVSGVINGIIIKGEDEIELEETDITSGQGTVKIPEGLEAGTYTVYLILKTTDNDYAFNSIEFTKKSTETIITITSTDIKYGEVAVIDFTLTDIDGNKITGDLLVSIGDENRTVPVENGVGSIENLYLNAGKYTVIANYLGNENYTASNNYSRFNVEKLGTQILFENMNTKAVAPGDGKAGEWFYFTLKDSNGKPMPNTPMQIGFNGVIYDEEDGIITDENGTAKLQINLGYKGAYTFAICYLGDDNYNASFVVAKITVDCQTPKLTVPNKSYKATAKTKTLTATFKTAKGNPIAEKWVSFTVNGKTYKAKTNAKGVASVNVSIATKGSYTVTAKYAGDSTYTAISQKATLKIT